MVRILKRVVIYASLFYAMWLGVGCAIQRSMMFPRDYARPIPNVTDGIHGLETIWIDSPEGKVEAWFLPAIGHPNLGPRPTVLFAHGNAELIDHNVKALERYRRMGVNVMLCEFRGYGKSAGSPSQEAITEDFIKAYDYVVGRDDVDKSKIFFHGRSVGGGVVCSLANHREPAAIIVQSTFISMKKMAAKFALPAFLVSDPFDNEATLEKLDCPKLIFHGTQDRIIDISHGRRLAAVSSNATLIEYKCDHNDFPPDEKVFWRDIEQFLERQKITNLEVADLNKGEEPPK